MKKTYITPEMETYRLQTQGMLLDTSSLIPTDYGGGGVEAPASSRTTSWTCC